MEPIFSVIIPTHNRPEELAACLERLSPIKQAVSDSTYELIVTDDGRRLSARELVADRFPWARWTAGPARGPAANRNHGAGLAKGEWLIFIDDDCIPEAKLLDSYQRSAASELPHGIVVLEGPTIRMAEPSSLLWESPHNPDGGACISANFAIRKADFEVSGKFDERYPGAAMEDTEFFARFHKLGGITLFVADAIVHHPLRRIGRATSLANKWEGKVVHALDQNASSWTVTWRLPWHVMRVIQSRFRGQSWNMENLHAAWLFLQEWLIVLFKTPGWVRKWSRQPRSQFWAEHVKRFGPPARYGF